MSGYWDLSGRPAASPQWAQRLAAECWQYAVARTDPGMGAELYGVEELRVALGSVLGEAPERLVITSGVRSSAVALGDRLRRVVVEQPSFSGVPNVLRSVGCAVERGSWSELRSLPGPVWLTHPFRNPDGMSLTPADIAALATGRDSPRVVNEIYRWFGAAPRVPPDWLAVGSLAKLAGGGARIGWIRGAGAQEVPADLLRAVSPSRMAQLAWVRFATLGGIDRLAAEQAAEVSSARAALLEALGPLAPLDLRSGGGPAMLLRAPGATSGAELADRCYAAGVKVSAGEAFHMAEPSIRLYLQSTPPDSAYEAAQIIKKVVFGE